MSLDRRCRRRLGVAVVEALEARKLLAAQAPYLGAPFVVGTTPVTIQAEDYDLGGETVAYHDTTPTNTGGAYRSGADAGVDLKLINNTTNQYRLGDAHAGEWVEYTLNVQQAGTYTLELRLSQKDPNAKAHVEIDGVNVTGAVTVPDTNDFSTFKSVTKTLTLTAGQHVMRLAFDSVASNATSAGVDWMRLTHNVGSTPSGTPGAATAAAYVRNGSHAGLNFGSATDVIVKKSSTSGNTREAYLKFDLGNATTIGSAKLRLYGRLSDTQNGSVPVSIYSASNTSWSESSLKWSNKPASGSTVRGSLSVTGTSAKWYEIDLTSFAKAELAAGRKILTLVLKASASTDSQAIFASDETLNAPILSITAQAPPPPPPPQNLVVSAGAVSVNEGSQAPFTVKLATAPTSDVTVTISKNTGGDDDLVADLATLTFTAANWDVAQTVTVAALDDADFANGQATFTIASTGVTSKSVVATEADNDTPPPPPPPQNLVVAPGALTVNEAGQSTFTVKLATAPASDVIVTISKNAGGDADFSADLATLTFTADNWDAAQTVTLAAGADADAANGQAVFTVASDGVTSQTVTATEVDDDTQGLVLSHTALTINEAGQNAFTVQLAAQPLSDVIVSIAGNGAGWEPDLGTDQTTLTFTPANWDVAQTITVSAAADPDTADGQNWFTLSSSGLTSRSILATEDDDDVTRQPGTYYLSPSGADFNAGTGPAAAWSSIAKLNTMEFIPGDTILFQGGQTFAGGLRFNAADSGADAAGNLIAPVTVGSYGAGRATIDAGAEVGISVYQAGGITLRDLNVQAGAGNDENGITFYNDLSGDVKLSHVRIDDVTVSDFGENGLSLGGFNGESGYRDVEITDSVFRRNRDGITIYGPAFNATAPTYVNENVRVARVHAYENAGVAGASKPTGDGIALGSVRNGLVERSVAHHNGANNTAATGPIGIWAYDSDHIVIQHNESYENKRGSGGDGGGFDLDQNTSNSVMQYNYAHDNEGAGFLIYTAQQNNAHANNAVRYNISERDGRSGGYGGIVIGGRVGDLDVYNNTIYFPSGSFGTNGAVINFTNTGPQTVAVRNNILHTTGGARLINAPTGVGALFQRNAYWSGGGAVAIRWAGTTHSSVDSWLDAELSQERVDLDNDGALDRAALFLDPRLTDPGNGGTIGNADQLDTLVEYKLLIDSPLRDAGLDLEARYGIDPGDLDYFGTTIEQGGGYEIGAGEIS
ncbi:MAG: DNRLRE domain-containing protein [Tepidisphaeraceae bacterium]